MLKGLGRTLILAVFITLLTTPLFTHGNDLDELLVMYLPGMSMDDASYVATLLNTTDYGVAELNPTPPYDYILFMYGILTGEIYTYDKIPFNESHVLFQGVPHPWVEMVDQDWLNATWGNVSLINIPMINPSNHSNALNPLYNAMVRTLKPFIAIVGVNESIEWVELNTSLRVIVENEKVKILLDSYNITLSITQSAKASNEVRVSVNQTIGVEPGDYYVKFYLLSKNDTHITIFFPGTISSAGWLSTPLGEVTGTLPLWFLYQEWFSDRLDGEALKWWFNESLTAFEKVLNTTLSRSNLHVHLIYHPYFTLAEKMSGQLNSTELRTMVCNSVARMISGFSARKPSALIILLNPFQIIGEPSISPPGVRLMPGVYNVTGNLTNLYEYLSSVGGINYTLINNGAEQYFVVNTPELEGVGNGLVFYTPRALLAGQNTGSIKASNLAHYLFMMSTNYNPSIGILIDLLNLKNSVISGLNATIDELKLRVTELNSTLTNLREELSTCQSVNANLSTRILVVEEELKRAEELRNQAYIFITTGLVGLIIIAAGLSLIVGRAIFSRQKP
ncbi:hypothetical protein IMZ38_04275 [Thermosphaera chiliense]|uniref:Uncharacterized protein n=1 Tax=Thermosphaera chiliense TaxID=3402707 RepID=A0A7M1UT16_9CREN|nr:hypothetical protein [Thermosphaera aggregans]QOR93874.1 hypothetical protein IMZ38_04275 [Thermosphaera aggregans]